MLSLADKVLRVVARGLLRLPAIVVQKMAGSPVHNARGDRLDPALQWMLRLQRQLGPPEEVVSDPLQARANLARSIALAAGPPPPLHDVADYTLPGPRGPIEARSYRPREGILPVTVYLHGGGWVVGDLDSHDVFCRHLAQGAGRLVVAIDYGLAPEAPFPAGLEDAIAAVTTVRDHVAAWGGDPAHIEIAGDSAGANLATLLCGLMQPPPQRQLLIYPATDLRRGHASHTEFGQGFVLTSASMDVYLAHYGAPLDDAQASPLLANDLRRHPPALVVTAGFDPLRDEGEAYADALEAAGVRVRRMVFPGLVHGFINMDGLLPAAAQAVGQIAQAWAEEI